MLEHLKRQAIAAHNGTSFDPEKRGEQLIYEYETVLQHDLNEIADASEEVKETYKQRFIKYLNAWLCSKGRIVSPMISGPSNFPVRRMEKYRNWERNASEKFTEFRYKAKAGILKQIQRDKPAEVKANELWQKIEANIMEHAEIIKAIDNGTEKRYSRQLMVKAMTGSVKTIAKNGNPEHVRKAIELVNQINSTLTKPILKANNSFFGLVEEADAAGEAKRDAANRQNNTVEFEGGEVIYNYEANRIQIKYDSKPNAETIAALKKKAFKWSPSQGTWQRQLTNAAIYEVQNLLKIQLERIM